MIVRNLRAIELLQVFMQNFKHKIFLKTKKVFKKIIDIFTNEAFILLINQKCLHPYINAKTIKIMKDFLGNILNKLSII